MRDIKTSPLYLDLSKNPYMSRYFELAEEIRSMTNISLKSPSRGECLMSEQKRKQLRKKRKRK